MVSVKTVEFGLFFGGRQATDQSESFCKREQLDVSQKKILILTFAKSFKILLNLSFFTTKPPHCSLIADRL